MANKRGSTVGRMSAVFKYGAFVSVVLGAFDFAGGLRGKKPEMEGMDDKERADYIRRNRRRPIEETIAHVGEGRGTSTKRCLSDVAYS